MPLLTVRDALKDRLAGFDAGADGQIVKPFVMAEDRRRSTTNLGMVPTEMFEVNVHSDGDTKRVFDLLSDIPAWQEWGRPFIPTSVRERDGAPDPNGVGAVRRAGWVREEIVEFIPPVRLAYIIVSGVPVRRYRAIVELEPGPAGGTSIRWRGQFEPRFRGTGPLLNRLLRASIQTVATKLAVAAGR